MSFETPEYTANSDALGTLRLLEAIRILGLEQKTRFYQASTSEMYGKVQETPQTRDARRSIRARPTAWPSSTRYWITVNYREAYGLFACNGILFNHESPVRGETFVTRKITRGLARITQGLQDCLYLGNLDARRDWGHARDYVEAQWLMLQQAEPDDFVIATGEQHSRARVRRARAARGSACASSGAARASRSRASNAVTGETRGARRPALLPADRGGDAARRRRARRARSSAGSREMQLRRRWCARWCDADLEHARRDAHGDAARASRYLQPP